MHGFGFSSSYFVELFGDGRMRRCRLHAADASRAFATVASEAEWTGQVDAREVQRVAKAFARPGFAELREPDGFERASHAGYLSASVAWGEAITVARVSQGALDQVPALDAVREAIMAASDRAETTGSDERAGRAYAQLLEALRKCADTGEEFYFCVKWEGPGKPSVDLSLLDRLDRDGSNLGDLTKAERRALAERLLVALPEIEHTSDESDSPRVTIKVRAGGRRENYVDATMTDEELQRAPAVSAALRELEAIAARVPLGHVRSLAEYAVSNVAQDTLTFAAVGIACSLSRCAWPALPVDAARSDAIVIGPASRVTSSAGADRDPLVRADVPFAQIALRRASDTTIAVEAIFDETRWHEVHSAIHGWLDAVAPDPKQKRRAKAHAAARALASALRSLASTPQAVAALAALAEALLAVTRWSRMNAKAEAPQDATQAWGDARTALEGLPPAIATNVLADLEHVAGALAKRK